MICEGSDQIAFKCSTIMVQGYMDFIMFSSAENEILNADKYKNIKKFSFFRLR